MIFSSLNSVDERPLITHFYSYNAAPPIRTGSYTKKVLETLERTAEYGKSYTQSTFHNKESLYESEDEINGIHQPKLVAAMAARAREKHGRDAFRRVFGLWKDEIISTHTAELTSGRQTYCPFQDRNVPAPIAYEYLNRALEIQGLEPLKNFFVSFKTVSRYLNKIQETPDGSLIEIPTTKASKRNSQGIIVETVHSTVHVLKETLLKRVYTLSAFIKQQERGQMESRSIASPNMIFRIFITALEKLGKIVLRQIEGSGIEQSSVDKLNSIIGLKSSGKSKMWGITGDNTKWNECISIPMICLMFKHLFAYSIDEEEVEGFHNFLSHCSNLFINKRLKVGPGIGQQNNAGFCKNLSFSEHPMSANYPYDRITNTIRILHGMIMGMANICSTVFAMICTTLEILKIQSSDDWIGLASGNSEDSGLHKYIKHKEVEKAFCMNHSKDKTVIVEGAYAMEYNSIYNIGYAVSNISTDLPSLIPAGRNPIDDYNMLIKTTREIISKNAYAIELAPIALNVVNNIYRKAYFAYPDSKEKYSLNQEINEKYNFKVHPYHGGEAPHSTTSLHLDTVELMRSMGKLDEEYYARMINDNNPVNNFPEDKVLIKFDSSKGKEFSEDYISNVLKWTWIENRTARTTSSGQKMNAVSREYQSVLSFLNKIAPDAVKLGYNSDEKVLSYSAARLYSALMSDPEFSTCSDNKDFLERLLELSQKTKSEINSMKFEIMEGIKVSSEEEDSD